MPKQPGVPSRKVSRSSNPGPSSASQQAAVPTLADEPPQENPNAGKRSKKRPGRKLNLKRLLLDWRFVTIAGLILTTSLTTLSIAFILKLPAVPNCPAIFWPLATASMRLHCAQIAASKHSVQDLIEAIELVNGIPKDHPLYEEASRWIEDWSTELLDLAQEKFNTGKLDEAIAAAQKIPPHASAAKQVEERITTWKKTWAEAEAILAKIDELLSKRKWRDAFNEATKLLAIDNPYWQNKRYSEINQRISSAKEDITKLAAADRAIADGNSDDLLKAYQDLDGISDKSLVYKEVQDIRPRIGKRLMQLAENAADRGAFDEALSIANKIPESLKVKQDLDDFIVLVSAQSKAKKGDLIEIEDAISQAERIPAGRPLHARAQSLAARWKAEVREIAQLNRAKELARSGTPEGVQAAMVEVSSISSSNSKFKETQDFINQSSNKVQTNQDQVTLDQADTMAASGDAASLQTAIKIARQISSNSSLYKQAQAKIKSWSTALQRQENTAAIPSPKATTEPLSADQSLFAQANALAQSNSGRPDDLLQAIGIAQQISGSGRSQAKAAIDQWSDQVLQAAASQSAYDQAGAINLASQIPSGTAAYSQAQAQIATWKKQIGQR